jgi:hypothetical protein
VRKLNWKLAIGLSHIEGHQWPWQDELCTVLRSNSQINSLWSSYYLFGGAGVWTQGLMLAREVLYHLSHTFNSFCFSYFLYRISTFCLGPTSDCDPPTYASQVTRVIITCHHIWPVCWIGVLLTFGPEWPWILTLPIFTSYSGGELGKFIYYMKICLYQSLQLCYKFHESKIDICFSHHFSHCLAKWLVHNKCSIDIVEYLILFILVMIMRISLEVVEYLGICWWFYGNEKVIHKVINGSIFLFW